MSFVRFSSTLTSLKKMELLFIYLLLFSVINPIGTVLFLLTQDDDKERSQFPVDRCKCFCNNDYLLFFREYVLSFSGLAWKPYV
jgi:hypothetical protein